LAPLLAGGNPDPTAELFNSATGAFTATGDMKTPQAFHAAVVVP
jgi:hypothetical protein